MSRPRPQICETLAAVAPYALWMTCLFAGAATARAYAFRTALTASALAMLVPGTTHLIDTAGRRLRETLAWGLLGGLGVALLWIAPESIGAYRDFSLLGALGLGGAAGAALPSPYAPETCGWPLTLVRLIGSAFVIAPVEELFFRSFLYRYLQRAQWTRVEMSKFDLNAFLWTLSLFALEHHTRLAAGAMAGAVYGYLAIRRGVGAAILAHVVTNLLLGLYVISTGEWGLW